jgi:hypothetical protein
VTQGNSLSPKRLMSGFPRVQTYLADDSRPTCPKGLISHGIKKVYFTLEGGSSPASDSLRSISVRLSLANLAKIKIH